MLSAGRMRSTTCPRAFGLFHDFVRKLIPDAAGAGIRYLGPLARTAEGAIVTRPLITIKYAQTLDGCIATARGDSRWISGPESRAAAHRLRAAHSAILVGIGTILADDPLLTVRWVEGRDPLRVVVDSRLRVPLDAAVLRDSPSNTLFATTFNAPREKREVLERVGATVVRLPAAGNGVDLATLFEELGARGLESVLVEGGAAIITSLLSAQLADYLTIFIAPKVLGRGRGAVGSLGIEQLGDAITFSQRRTELLGQDLMFHGAICWTRR